MKTVLFWIFLGVIPVLLMLNPRQRGRFFLGVAIGSIGLMTLAQPGQLSDRGIAFVMTLVMVSVFFWVFIALPLYSIWHWKYWVWYLNLYLFDPHSTFKAEEMAQLRWRLNQVRWGASLRL